MRCFKPCIACCLPRLQAAPAPKPAAPKPAAGSGAAPASRVQLNASHVWRADAHAFALLR